jgi:hypothetical protein
MATIAHLIENTSFLPRTAASIAAALLVLEPYPYVVANDVGHSTKNQIFSEPETFLQMWRSQPSIFLDSTFNYNFKLDTFRTPSAKIFSDPEIFPQQQRGSAVVVLDTYPVLAQQFTSSRSMVVENTTASFRGQKGSLLVLAQKASPAVPADAFLGSDTFIGWPLETFEPPIFPQTWKAYLAILNSAPSYVPGTDVLRAKQAQVWSDPDFWGQSWRTNVTILNGTAAYVFVNDFRFSQSKVFPEPEVFLQPWLFNSVVMQSFTPYSAATDTTQLKSSAKVFTDPDVFDQSQHGSNVVVLNVPPAPPYVQQDVSVIGMRIRPGGFIQMNIRPNSSYPV